MSAERPDISVIIPTRDRPQSLARCLEAVRGQSAADLEIIVVDDASAAPDAVAAVARSAGARVVPGTGRGPAAARNLGAALARAPVICFTDDDCEPEPAWAERLAAALARADAAAGLTLNVQPGVWLATASQLITNFVAYASRSGDGDEAGFGPSSNLGVRAEVFERLRFDETFPLAAGEDREWCARLRREGGRLVHAPTAVVAHRQELDLRRFWRQQLRYGHGARRFRAGAQDQAGLEPWRFYRRLLGAAVRAGPAVAAAVLLAQVATAWGYGCELVAPRRRAA